MSETTHSAFFGDAKYPFILTPALIRELETKCGAGVGLIVQRVNDRTFYHADLIEIVRLALIGGGADAKRAAEMIDAYAKPQPIEPLHLLATDIINAAWFGAATELGY